MTRHDTPPNHTVGQRPGRRRAWIGAGATLVAAGIAAVLLIDLDGVAKRESTAESEDALDRGSGPVLPRAMGSEPSLAPEELAQATCWEGLLEFDRAASLDTLRRAIGPALAAGDTTLAAYLQERLSEVIGNDADRALQVVEWIRAGSGPTLEIYMEALRAAPAVRHSQVAGRLLQIGGDATVGVEQRAAALAALDTQAKLSAEGIEGLESVALEPAAGGAAWMATRTLGRIMKEDFERTGSYAPYWRGLLHIAESSGDDAVRQLALEMPAYADPVLGAEEIDDLAGILKNESEREIRALAAFNLSLTEDAERALEVYRTAFPRERDLCVRWAMFRFALRAAGPGAFPLLREFTRQDKRFARDLVEFEDLYARGTTDFERIWLDKPEHHPCTFEEGAVHGG